MPLLLVGLAWLSGITAGAVFTIPAWTLALALPFSAAALLCRQQRRAFILAAICLLALCGGALRCQSHLPAADNTTLQFYNEKGKLQVEGMVTGPPKTSGYTINFRFKADSVTYNDSINNAGGVALVRLPFYANVAYGDRLQLTGKLQTPQQFDDFDYRNYLANQGIYSIINYPQYSVLKRGEGFPPLMWIYTARAKLAESLSLCLPEPQGALSQAILLGLRGNLPDSLVQSFYITGTTHLIAISGLNLTIVLGIVLSLSVWLLGRKNRLYIWISLVFIWLYTLVTGLPVTMLRAAFMGSVFLLAELLGRQRNGLSAIFLSAIIMSAINPRILWDVSFQLSFFAILGLSLMAPYLIRFSSFDATTGNKHLLRLKQAVTVTFGTTLAAILATWPLIALNFNSISLVSLPATFFAMPSFPGIITTSMLTAITGLVWQPLGMITGWITWLFVSYFLQVVNIFSAIPAASITGIDVQPWQAVAYYIALSLIIIFYVRRNTLIPLLKRIMASLISALRRLRFKSLIMPLLAVLVTANILVWAAIAVLPDGKLHVTILDVGQGDSILVRTPSGHNILVDTGPGPSSANAQLGRILPFWDRTIDLIILTQPQADHIAGTAPLIHKYNVSTLASPPSTSRTALTEEIQRTAEANNIKTIYLQAGKQIYLGPRCSMAVINPPATPFSGTGDDINNNSLVIRLCYNNVSFLLTADIGASAEKWLMDSRADLCSNVLKVAHHGSRESTSEEFLAIVRPQAAAISAGIHNHFGHPSLEVIQRLQTYTGTTSTFTTIDNGNIEFISDGIRLWYRLDKKQQ